MEFPPFARNYRLAAEGPKPDPNPVAYTRIWLAGLHHRLFFMIDGPPAYTNYRAALLPSLTAVVIFYFSVCALLFYGWQTFRKRPFLVFLLGASIAYAVTLWGLQTYPQYLETGQPVAINGRYFIPLLLPMAAVAAAALGAAFRRWPDVKIVLVVAAVLLFSQGGGVFSFILRSDASWYWPNRAVTSVNQTAQSILSKVMYIGPKGY